MKTCAMPPRNGWSINSLILAVTVFILMTGNRTFIDRLLDHYPADITTVLPLMSLALVFGGVFVLMVGSLCFRRSTRPLLISLLLVAATASHFMDTYGVIISDDMLRNVMQTSAGEAGDLLTLRLLAYLVLLGFLPAWFVVALPLRWEGIRKELAARGKLLAGALALVILPLFAFGDFYASFFRVNKELRQLVNPTYSLYSAMKLASQSLQSGNAGELKPVGTDAVIPAVDTTRDLVILVVGETARADRFSINGYSRETTPLLAGQGVVSFSNFHACGTSTAISLPCMFLRDGEAGGNGRIGHEENLIDVLLHAGVHVLWRDNNSDSKGVAVRANYQDFKTPARNPLCNPECRDEGMLAELQDFIDSKSGGDILIVLHQMGSHGPAYWRRYPPEFEKYKPACRDSDLSRCTREEINNAYDNTILYTDHFLNEAIKLLKRNDDRFETALFYVSDHGESLGENGLYLHGIPKTIAPQAQLHVPALMWLGKNFRPAKADELHSRSAQVFSHKNLFHTVLGFFEIQTVAYDPAQDMLKMRRSK